MDRDTLIAALVGALIATIPILISNVVQIMLHVSDRQQKEKEVRIQAREKWIERDILKITDLIEQMYILLSGIRGMGIQIGYLLDGKKNGRLAQEEFDTKFKSLFDHLPNLDTEVNQVKDMIGGLVYSFTEDEILSSYGNLVDTLNTYVNQVSEDVNSVFIEQRESNKSDMNIVSESVGKFQRALRNKLISLRE